MTIVERVARVLAGQHFSRNAEGAAPPNVPASDLVDRNWHDYVDDALAVLRTLREPDAQMIAAGEARAAGGVADIWDAMVRTAVGEEAVS
jgi:hypothetical protein